MDLQLLEKVVLFCHWRPIVRVAGFLCVPIFTSANFPDLTKCAHQPPSPVLGALAIVGYVVSGNSFGTIPFFFTLILYTKKKLSIIFFPSFAVLLSVVAVIVVYFLIKWLWESYLQRPDWSSISQSNLLSQEWILSHILICKGLCVRWNVVSFPRKYQKVIIILYFSTCWQTRYLMFLCMWTWIWTMGFYLKSLFFFF